MGVEANRFYNRLNELLVEKKSENVREVKNWIHTRLRLVRYYALEVGLTEKVMKILSISRTLTFI